MINMWTADGDCLQSQGAHRMSVNCLSEFQSYDNNVDPSVCSNPSFVSSGGDSSVKVWDSRRLKVISSFTAQSVTKLAWFHHSVITGSSTGAVSCWNLQSNTTDEFPGADSTEQPRTWASTELASLPQACTDVVSDKYCVACSSKSGQILRWVAS